MIRILVYSIVLLGLLVSVYGCSQQGETVSEGHRRHQRIISINQQQLNEDIDKALLIDEPSKLTRRRIP